MNKTHFVLESYNLRGLEGNIGIIWVILFIP